MSFLIFLAGFGLPPTQQLPSAQVPAAVQVAFRRVQPQATHPAWQRCPAGYEVAFTRHPADRLPGERALRGQLTFKPAGELVASRLDVTYQEFPTLGRTAISQQYPHRELDRIIRVVDAQGVVSYEVKICQGKDKNGRDKNCQTSCFDKDGRPLLTPPDKA